MQESWIEYVQKYPERLQPFAWCSECRSKLDIEKAFLAWSLESKEIYVLDLDCLHKYNQFDELSFRPLSGTTKADLEELIEKDDISKLDIEKQIEQLKFWGILPLKDEEYGITNQGEKKYARGSMTNSKRYDVLRRDQFQCVLCGASGSEASLEIDHIIPVSKGGSDDMENLRCLCFRCNRGKQSKIE